MPSDKRCLLVSSVYPPPFVGGSGVWTYNMAENCPAVFDILTGALQDGAHELEGTRHRIIRSRLLWNRLSGGPSHWDLLRAYTFMAVWVLRHVRRSRYDAIVAGNETFANGLLIVLGTLLAVPVIALGNAEEFTVVMMGKRPRNAIKRWWIRATHKRAAGFVVVCHFCRDLLVDFGVSPDHIEIVPSSINQVKLHPADPNRVRGHRVLSVGRLIERKGFHLLVEAVARLREEFPAITLTIVGDGPYRSEIEARVHQFDAASCVAIKGRLPDGELARLYWESDVFVLAHMMLDNGDTEGCPTVFSEAAGSGLPVIGGTGGGAATAIVEGVTGFIVNSRNVDELADRLRLLLGDPELAKRMGLAGISKVKRDHDPKRSGLAFYEAIRRFSGREPRTGPQHAPKSA